MYEEKCWRLINHNEHECSYAGKYGAKGEKRQKRKKPTPEQVRKQNQRNREARVRRLIRGNFYPGDYWVTLKYRRGTRKDPAGLKKDMSGFLRIMRRAYAAREEAFKFIYRLEVGRRGGLHAHIIINRLPGDGGTDLIIRDAWARVTETGSVNYTTIREQGGCKELAEYIVKPAGEEIEGQMSLFSPEDQKKLLSISSSKNLIRHEPDRKLFRHWTMRRLLQNGPSPTPGYYIDKDSIVCGVNRFTGLSYYRYTEVRIRQIDCRSRREPEGGRDG